MNNCLNTDPYKTVLKYLSFALYNASLSKALNKYVGACLVSPNSEIPIGAYNGPPRGIPEVDNWGRFDTPTLNKLISKLPNIGGAYSLVKPQDPRYLLGYTSGNGLKYMIDVHAEANAIYNAARMGISTIGSTLYITSGLPCKECSKSIIQAGIDTVWCSDKDLTNDDSEYNFHMSRWLLATAGVNLRTYPEEIMNLAIKSISERNWDEFQNKVKFISEE